MGSHEQPQDGRQFRFPTMAFETPMKLRLSGSSASELELEPTSFPGFA